MSSFLVVHLPEGGNPAWIIDHANLGGFSWNVCYSLDEMSAFVNDVWNHTSPQNIFDIPMETQIKEEEYDPGELIIDNFQVKYRAAGALDPELVGSLPGGQNMERVGCDFPSTSLSSNQPPSFAPIVSRSTERRCDSTSDLNDFEMSEEEKEASKEPVREEYERIGRRYYRAERNRLPEPGDIFQSLTSDPATLTWPAGFVIPRPRLPHEFRQDGEVAKKPESPAAVRTVVNQNTPSCSWAGGSISFAPRPRPQRRQEESDDEVPAAVLDVINQLFPAFPSTSKVARNTPSKEIKAEPDSEFACEDYEVEKKGTSYRDVFPKKPKKSKKAKKPKKVPSSHVQKAPSSFVYADEEDEESDLEIPSKPSSSDEYIDSDWERKQERINKELNKPPPKVYSCWVKNCGALFPSMPKLEEHVPAAHPGKKPYVCTQCKKEFLKNTTLIDHIKISHSDAEPEHKCPVCNKGFHRSDYLKTHIRLHTGEMPYECKKCGKKYSNRPNYMVHLRVHTPKRVKPFRCKHCGKAYRHSPTLTHHIRKHHPEELENEKEEEGDD